MNAKPLIYRYELSDISNLLQDWGEPAYRASQIWKGLYQHLHSSWENFTTLSLDLRRRLGENFALTSLQAEATVSSADGQTTKTLFRLPDDRPVEAVLMRYRKRRTLCISTQAGCAMGCVFCATGQMGFLRHLSSGEIVEQVIHYARQLAEEGERVTNIVLMGMGEPFHNYEATMSAIDRLNHPEGFNLGARRFTVSTVGLVPMIKRFADEGSQINLAVSLHTTDDALRSSMIPINRKYPVRELLDACREYVEKTNRRITFEWALIRDVNDSPEHARQLAEHLKGLLSHVNVIPLNPTQGYEGEATTRARAEAFRAELERHGIPCTIRMRRGIDIQAGCGQLASERTL
jgi:23S rRNA (adenine2503-C2)-methyltransferase